MSSLKIVSSVVGFIVVLIIELLVGIIAEFPEIRIYPFLILLYYISLKKFSNSLVLAFFLSGIYYDLFYTSNYFGSTSAKFILIGVVVNFLANKINDSLINEFGLFLIALLIYKIETIIYTLSFNQLLITISISAINYFLFKIISVTLKRDVFKKTI